MQVRRELRFRRGHSDLDLMTLVSIRIRGDLLPDALRLVHTCSDQTPSCTILHWKQLQRPAGKRGKRRLLQSILQVQVGLQNFKTAGQAYQTLSDEPNQCNRCGGALIETSELRVASFPCITLSVFEAGALPGPLNRICQRDARERTRKLLGLCRKQLYQRRNGCMCRPKVGGIGCARRK